MQGGGGHFVIKFIILFGKAKTKIKYRQNEIEHDFIDVFPIRDKFPVFDMNCQARLETSVLLPYTVPSSGHTITKPH